MFAAGPRLTSWTSSVAVATSATSAARRRGLEITRTSPWGQTGLVEALGDHGAKLLDGIVQRCGGHFLRTNLKQEILSVCHGLRHLAFLVGILVDSGDLGHVGLAARLGDGADAQDVVGTLDRG